MDVARIVPMCRFCWGTKDNKNNKLFNPCECKGTLEYVHQQCLNRWRYMDPHRNGMRCLLCMTVYRLPDANIFEEIPNDNTWFNVALRYPFFLFAIIFYIWIFHQQHANYNSFNFYNHSSLSLINPYQYIFQGAFAVIAKRQWKVKNKILYFKLWCTPQSFFIFISHFLCLFYFLLEYYYMIIPLVFSMGLYYKNHKIILLRINRSYYS